MLGIKNLAKKSCRFVHFNKKKVKKKKSWIDTEFKDLKKTVLNLGSEVKKQPFNSQLELIILHIVNQTSQLYSRTGWIKISKSLHDKFTGNV
jgi:hypothetical protein